MGADQRNSNMYKEKLYMEISEKSGVSIEHVKNILKILGIDKHFDEAAKLLGGAPNLGNLLIGFRTSPSSVTV